MANAQVRMTAKGSMDVYSGRPLCTTTADFVMNTIHFPKHQKVDDVATALNEIVHINYYRFSYCHGAKAIESDSPTNAVHYNPTGSNEKDGQKLRPSRRRTELF